MQGTVLVTYTTRKAVPSVFNDTVEAVSFANFFQDDISLPSYNTWNTLNLLTKNQVGFDDVTQVFADDGDDWVVNPVQASPPGIRILYDTDALPIAAVVPALDEDSYLPLPQQLQRSTPLQLDVDTLAIFANPVEEEFFINYLPWVVRALFLLSVDPDSIPTVTIDEEMYWTTIPWGRATTLTVVSDTQELPLTPAVFEEEVYVSSTPWTLRTLPLLSIDPDVLPRVTTDTEVFLPLSLWSSTTQLTLLWDTELLPTAPLVIAIEDEVYLQYFSWISLTPPLPLVDPDAIPGLEIAPAFDEHSFFTLERWVELNLPLSIADADTLAFATASFYLDEDYLLSYNLWLLTSPSLLFTSPDEISATSGIIEDTLSLTFISWRESRELPFLSEIEGASFVNFPLEEFPYSPERPWIELYRLPYSYAEELLFIAPPTETLYVIEVVILPSADGVVGISVAPTGLATQVTVRQGSLGFLTEVL